MVNGTIEMSLPDTIRELVKLEKKTNILNILSQKIKIFLKYDYTYYFQKPLNFGPKSGKLNNFIYSRSTTFLST